MGAYPKGRCDRCGKKSRVTSFSWFNTDELCPECAEKEQNHPDYQRAKDADREAVLRGDYNFAGIGLPADIK